MVKKSLLSLVVLAAIFTMVSCHSSTPMVQTPKFTSVERLCEVKMGSTFDATVSTLGSMPYDVLSRQADGYSIYVYKYKRTEREVNPDVLKMKGNEASGTEVYNEEMSEVVLFFKDDKLEMILTDAGKISSPRLILLNNTLYVFSKNADGQYILDYANKKVDAPKGGHKAAPAPAENNEPAPKNEKGGIMGKLPFGKK